MENIVIKKATKRYIGDGGKSMIEVYYKGKFVDAVGTMKEVAVIKKAIRQDEIREKALGKF